MKIVWKDKMNKKEYERFFTEIGILKTLDHPNIVNIYEVYQDSKRFYIVTE